VRLAYRHPVLLTVNFVATVVISALCGFAFYAPPGGDDSELDLDSGVLQRIGLLFFLGTYFLLTALVSLGMWQQERLIYFQELAAGCYTPFTYMFSKMVCDMLPLRLVPALASALIIYPMVGLRHDGPKNADDYAPGPLAAATFVAALCLVNLTATTVTSAIGIVSRTQGGAIMTALVYILFTMLFCGLLVNIPTLRTHGAFAGFLPRLSVLSYFMELVLVNELHKKMVDVKPRYDPGATTIPPIFGEEVLAQLGYACKYNTSAGADSNACLFDDGECLIPGLNCTVLFDLEMLVVWVVAGLVVCYLLLRYCVRDTH